MYTSSLYRVAKWNPGTILKKLLKMLSMLDYIIVFELFKGNGDA